MVGEARRRKEVSLPQGKSERLAPLEAISAPICSVPTMRCSAPNPYGGDGVSSGDDGPGRRGIHTPHAARPLLPAVLSR
jgi:hypothetical protein